MLCPIINRLLRSTFTARPKLCWLSAHGDSHVIRRWLASVACSNSQSCACHIDLTTTPLPSSSTTRAAAVPSDAEVGNGGEQTSTKDLQGRAQLVRREAPLAASRCSSSYAGTFAAEAAPTCVPASVLAAQAMSNRTASKTRPKHHMHMFASK